MKRYITATLLSTMLLFTTFTPAQAATFKDVSKTHWAYEAIDNICNRGLINGYSDGTYRLNEPVTRAQAAKIVAIAIGVKPSATFKPRFKDVNSANGFYDHIRALTELGVFTNGEKFHPNVPLTREEMAKIFVLGYKINVDNNDLIKLTDVQKNNPYYDYIITLAEIGITKTPPGGEYKPNDQVSRAHMAAFIHRTMEFDNRRQKGTIVYDKETRNNNEATKPVPIVNNALETIDLVNKERSQLGEKALLHDKDLSAIAQAKAEDMAKNNYFAHISPTYGAVDQLLAFFNYKWTAYGENIAKGQLTPKSVVEDWVNSPGHQANISSSKFTHIGAGYTTDATGTTYWVHEFSRK